MTFPSSRQIHAEWKTDGKSFVLFNLSFLESLNHRVPAYCSAKGVGTSPLSVSHRSLGMNLAPGAPLPAHRSYYRPAMNTGTHAILLPQSPSTLQASNQIQQKTPQPGMVDFFRKCAPPPTLRGDSVSGLSQHTPSRDLGPNAVVWAMWPRPHG